MSCQIINFPFLNDYSIIYNIQDKNPIVSKIITNDNDNKDTKDTNNDLNIMINIYLSEIKKNNDQAMYLLAMYYKNYKPMQIADKLKYLQLAIKHNNSEAMIEL